jgi:hypothetical protein
MSTGRSASVRTEIARLKADIEALKLQRNPSRWIELIDAPPEKIQQALDMGFHVIENVIRKDARILEPDELTPELKQIRDETREREKQEREEAERSAKEVRRAKNISDEQRPFPLNYPKQVF